MNSHKGKSANKSLHILLYLQMTIDIDMLLNEEYLNARRYPKGEIR
jgi:hypothetical protein